MTWLERRFVIALIVMGGVAITYFAYRLALGASLQPDTTMAPVMRTTAVIPVSPGHAYQYVAAPDKTWDKARLDAKMMSWQGHPGYLATIDDAAEFRLIIDTLFKKQYPDTTYLGGHQTAMGEWRWVTGPDGRSEDGKGKLLWHGFENGAGAASAFGGWQATTFNHGGKWDSHKICCVTLFSYHRPQLSAALGDGDPDEGVAGYLVEFGG